MERIFDQKVRWGPLDGRPAGVRVLTADDEALFLPWLELREELNRNLFPQLFADAQGFTIKTADYHGKRDWLVQIYDESGEQFCDAWFGINPDTGWGYDGLVHVGDASDAPHVWQTYQRYSDGTYRRHSSLCATIDEFKRRSKR